MLRFKGSEHFRQRLILSNLSGKPIRIDDIRTSDENPGLRDYEASLLRLLEKITNGCVIEINETGTSLRYKPGFIHGGTVDHDCGASRAIGYFLEPLSLLSLWGRKPLTATLIGITNDATDPTVDTWRTVTLPLLKALSGLDKDEASGGGGGDFELRIVRRGAPPNGGGQIILRIPIIKQTISSPVNLIDEGMVKRIRGIAYSTKVSPQASNRMVDGARGVLNALLADVFIFTDHMSGKEGGLSPGYGITLVAETTTGRMLAAEASMASSSNNHRRNNNSNYNNEEEEEEEVVPEDLGRRAAHSLLEEVSRGGVVDGSHQGLVLLMAALGPDEMSEVRLGPLTPYAVRTMRHIKDFFNVQFSVRPERESGTVFLSCIGAGYKNVSKKLA
jgi:RNA 3'-terminal phosphate cyclase-like protein